MQIDAEKLTELGNSFHLSISNTFSYGTAGFRSVGLYLVPVSFRMGLLMAALSVVRGRAVGACLTASHNPRYDNGLKLVDHDGTMLPQDWEPLAERLANATPETAPTVLKEICEERQVALGGFAPRVIVGRDTRHTGPALLKAFTAAVEAVGGSVVDHGVVTTPQLHFFVWQQDAGANLARYQDTVRDSFLHLLSGKKLEHNIFVDCSNGVGHAQLEELAGKLGDAVTLKLYNGNTDMLNVLCGADYVQKEKRLPKGANAGDFGEADHLVSFDGDADRLVYFYLDGADKKEFRLLDGDRIAVLLARYVKRLIDAVSRADASFAPKVGIVQTAYANGASTRYMRGELQVDTALTPTGVKHLHKKAHEDFDIGIYFEANGHGTVLAKQPVLDSLAAAAGAGNKAAADLQAVLRLASPVCGDAIADLLLCEAALAAEGMTIADWAALYTDAPSKMTKQEVSNPGRVKTTWDQTRTTEPAGLQEAIDRAVSRFEEARAFVRPSGTEPVVRVYAEARTQEDADALVKAVEEAVEQALGDEEDAEDENEEASNDE